MNILAVCPKCSTGNRLGDGDPNAAKCGRCGARLFTGAPVDVDDAAFAAQLKMSSMPVLVDVWAPWCGPCRAMAPTFATAAAEFEPRVRFLKLNADETRAPAQLGVRGIPALILFHEGREVARYAGLMTREQLDAWLTRALHSLADLELQS
jgi:thioredoxin 2